jgi:AcrR family transcriptional regulator
MDNRERILEAAKRVYAQHGFRGATTRLIAVDAGVNEVTLFRTFGSKKALFEEVMRSMTSTSRVPELPARPADPERELTEWCTATLARMRASASLLRKSIAELEERPDAATFACEGANCAGEQLTSYVARLTKTGLADGDADTDTAVSMFMSALFGDAMCREIMPDAFPRPANQAPGRYVRTFLRAVGARAAVQPKRARAAMSR